MDEMGKGDHANGAACGEQAPTQHNLLRESSSLETPPRSNCTDGIQNRNVWFELPKHPEGPLIRLPTGPCGGLVHILREPSDRNGEEERLVQEGLATGTCAAGDHSLRGGRATTLRPNP